MFCKKLPRLACARPFCAQNGFEMRLPCARRVPPRGKALCAPRGSAPVPPHRTPASARAPAAEIFYKRRRIARIFRKCRRAPALCGKRQDVFPGGTAPLCPNVYLLPPFYPDNKPKIRSGARKAVENILTNHAGQTVDLRRDM